MLKMILFVSVLLFIRLYVLLKIDCGLFFISKHS